MKFISKRNECMIKVYKKEAYLIIIQIYKNALFWTLRNQRAKWNDNYYMKKDLNKKSADFLDIVGKISIFFFVLQIRNLIPSLNVMKMA